MNGDPDSRPAVARFNAADNFHHYRLVVDDELAMLFVDGSKQPIVSKAVGRPASEENQANLVYFGDGTQLAGGKSQLKDFFYASDSVSKSPFHPKAHR